MLFYFFLVQIKLYCKIRTIVLMLLLKFLSVVSFTIFRIMTRIRFNHNDKAIIVRMILHQYWDLLRWLPQNKFFDFVFFVVEDSSYFYRTRVLSLVMLVTDWLTNWLTNCCLVNLIYVTLTCKDDNSDLLRLLLLFMLMMRNVLTTVRCRFGRWSLVLKLSFCSDFENKVSRFGQDFEVDVQARF